MPSWNIRQRVGLAPVWIGRGAWGLMAAATAFWGWGILTISIDEGFTPPGTVLLLLLGLMTAGLVLSWRRTRAGALVLLLASLGIGGVTVGAALASPLENRLVLIAAALLFPLPWLGGSAILLAQALGGRDAAGKAAGR